MLVTIPTGTVAFDMGSRKRIAPKYQFNSPVTTAVVGTDRIGTWDYERLRWVVLVDGRRLSIPAETAWVN